MVLVYILVALLATVVGSVSGMGGGVIMKPIFDLLGDYNASQIAIVSASTVFVMSVVSVIRRFISRSTSSLKASGLLMLSVGSVIGGLVGEMLFKLLTATSPDRTVKLVQNALLIVLIACIIVYMANKHKIASLNRQGWVSCCAVGIILGIISSFLGIGGGPMNVAIIIFVFGVSMKEAVFCSLTTIIFAQLSKLTSTVITSGFSVFSIDILPFVVLAGVLGAVIGTAINRKVSNKTVEKIFLGVQILIVCLCVVNIIKFVL